MAGPRRRTRDYRSEMLPEPVRHVRVICRPRVLFGFVLLPGALDTIEELLPMALVLDDGVAFESVLVPVVVVIAVAVPLLGSVDSRHARNVTANRFADPRRPIRSARPAECGLVTADPATHLKAIVEVTRLNFVYLRAIARD